MIYFYENVKDDIFTRFCGGGVQICGGGFISASGFGPGGLNPLGHRNGGMTEWWNGRELRKILNTERRKITPSP